MTWNRLVISVYSCYSTLNFVDKKVLLKSNAVNNKNFKPSVALAVA